MIIVYILLNLSLVSRAESLALKDKLVILSLTKNHQLLEGKIKAIGSAEINPKNLEISQLKVKLHSKTLQFKDRKESDFFKSDSFFAADRFEEMIFTASKLKRLSSDGVKQVFSGDMEVKIKNRSEMVKIQAELIKTKNQCLIEFPLEIHDRTAKLGLKFNSKKFSSEVELGENLIDDKISFSFSLKCN